MAVLNYYDETNDKYIPLPIGSDTATYGNYQYSTEEQCIGEWIDGKPIYRKYIALSSGISIKATTWTDIYTSTENIEKLISFKAFNSTFADSIYALHAAFQNSVIKIYSISAMTALTFIIEYTKTTDAENSFTLDMLTTTTTIDSEATDDEVASIFE